MHLLWRAAIDYFLCFVSSFQLLLMSCATLMASKDAPERPFLVNPTAQSPAFPFHPLGNGFFGIPSWEKKSFSCTIQTFQTKNINQMSLFSRKYILFHEKGQCYLHNFLYRQLLKQNKDTNKKDLFKIGKKTFRIIQQVSNKDMVKINLSNFYIYFLQPLTQFVMIMLLLFLYEFAYRAFY